MPVPRGLRFQAVHSGDVAAAVVAAVERPVRGAVNLAGPGVVRRQEVARLFGARTVEVPSAVISTALATGFHSRLAPPELYDAFMRLPVLAIGRAERELGWAPRHTAEGAVSAFLSGAAMRAGSDLPPLHR